MKILSLKTCLNILLISLFFCGPVYAAHHGGEGQKHDGEHGKGMKKKGHKEGREMTEEQRTAMKSCRESAKEKGLEKKEMRKFVRGCMKEKMNK